MQEPPERPWAAGLRAARANFIPALGIQLIMLALLLGYYFYPPTTAALTRLAVLKADYGYGYSVVASIFAGAVIPEIARICIFQRGRMRSGNFKNLIFTVPFWAWSGFVVDFFYRQQALWFGNAVEFGVVAPKVLVDQFVFNPIYAAPFTVIAYDWKNSGYSLRGISRWFTPRYYRVAIIPTLFATWGVWIPIVAILYSLPPLLQIPLFALALSMWVLIYTWMSEDRMTFTDQVAQ